MSVKRRLWLFEDLFSSARQSGYIGVTKRKFNLKWSKRNQQIGKLLFTDR